MNERPEPAGASTGSGGPFPVVGACAQGNLGASDVAPASGATFWVSGDGVATLDDPTPFGKENALQKLGKPPFEKTSRGRFRLLGYLATVFEHVCRDVGGIRPEAAAADHAPVAGAERDSAFDAE